MQARQVEDPVRRRGLREQRPRRDGEVVGHRHDLELRAELARAQLDDLAHREHFLVADVEDRPRAAARAVPPPRRPRRRSSRCSRGGAASGRRRRRRCAAGRRGCAARSSTRAAPAGTGRRGTDSGSARRSDAPRTRPLPCGRCGSPSRRARDRRRARVLGDGHRQAGRVVQPRVRPPAVRGHAADGHEVIAPARRRGRDHAEPSVHRDDDVPRACSASASRNDTSSYGSAWMCTRSGGVSGRSCAPRCRIVTSCPCSTSRCTIGMPLGPVPPIIRMRMEAFSPSHVRELLPERVDGYGSPAPRRLQGGWAMSLRNPQLKAFARIACRRGGRTPSSASSCTGHRRRCRRSRRSTSTSASWCSRDGATRSRSRRTPSGTRTRCASPTVPVARHHREVYGNRPYEQFAAEWEAGLEQWDPHDWAARFAATGARYVVFVTKHMDGYCLWPTDVPNPRRPGWNCRRDVVGELGEAVRGGDALRDLLLGRARLDLQRPADRIGGGDARRDPARRLSRVRRGAGPRAHRPVPAQRAVERHRVAGRGQAALAAVRALLRSGTRRRRQRPVDSVGSAARRGAIAVGAPRTRRRGSAPGQADAGVIPPLPPHCDVRTPEYVVFDDVQRKPWECVRGMDQSFGYNACSRPEHFLAQDELLWMLTDIVAKGGNLLLNVGPRGVDAQIPDEQLTRPRLARGVGYAERGRHRSRRDRG